MSDTVLGSGNRVLTKMDMVPALMDLRIQLRRQLVHLIRWLFNESCERRYKGKVCRLRWKHKAWRYNSAGFKDLFFGGRGICDSPWPNKGPHVNKHTKAVCTLDELDWVNLSISKGSYSLTGWMSPSPLSQHPLHQRVLVQLPLSIPLPPVCSKPPSAVTWMAAPAFQLDTLLPHLSPPSCSPHSSQEWPLKVIHAIMPCPSPEKASVGFHFTLGKTPRLVAMPTRQDPAPGFLGPKALWPSFLWLSHQLLSFLTVPGTWQDLFFSPLSICACSSQYCSPGGWLFHSVWSLPLYDFLMGLPLNHSPSLLSVRRFWFISPQSNIVLFT